MARSRAMANFIFLYICDLHVSTGNCAPIFVLLHGLVSVVLTFRHNMHLLYVYV